jgi:hypothetical protein
MKPSELIPWLAKAFKNRRQILLKGPPGVGKSDIIDAAIRLAGAHGITRHPSVEDPLDVKGMPAKVTLEDGTEIAEFLPFKDLHQLLTATSLTVVHLEDFGQAPASVQKAYMQMLLRRQINGYKISDWVVFVGSTNETGQSAGVEGLLEPIKSRWHTIVTLQVCLDDWTVWAIDHNMPKWLIAYIRDFPDALNEFKPTKELTNSPCPRTWASVGRFSNEDDNKLEVWTGAVGIGRAREAYEYYESFRMPDADACLLDPLNAPLVNKPSLRYAMTAAIVYRSTAKNLDACLIYTGRMGKAFEVLCMTAAHRKDPKIAGCPAFGRWASDPVNRDIAL